jgi:DNA-binding CsgD family transcriptional regulator
MDFPDFIERSNRIRCPRELFSLLLKAAQDEGFTQLAYGALTYNEPLRLVDHPHPAIALNYSAQWQDRYIQRGYGAIDPVVTYAPSIAIPFLWDWFVIRCALSNKQRQLLNEAAEAGLKNGVTVPLHGPWGRVAVISFASQFNDVRPKAQLDRLSALASQFHVAFTSLGGGLRRDLPAVDLSPREKDCLRWTARGKSSWDISMILTISENTVNFHVKNAIRKLDATNRIVAVVKAIRLGLIDLPQF